MAVTKEEYLTYKDKIDKIMDEMGKVQRNSTRYYNLYQEWKYLESLVSEYELEYISKLLEENLEDDVNTCLEMMSTLDRCSIGRHVCGYGNKIQSKPTELADSILSRGLISARNEGGGVVENVWMMGADNVEQNLRDIIRSFYEHAVSTGKGGAVVAIPTTIINDEYKKVGLGEFPAGLDQHAKDDIRVINLPINRFVIRNGYLPPEFILGVVSQDKDENIRFYMNNRYIGLLPEVEQIKLYNDLISKGLRPDEIRGR